MERLIQRIAVNIHRRNAINAAEADSKTSRFPKCRRARSALTGNTSNKILTDITAASSATRINTLQTQRARVGIVSGESTRTKKIIWSIVANGARLVDTTLKMNSEKEAAKPVPPASTQTMITTLRTICFVKHAQMDATTWIREQTPLSTTP